MRYLSTVMMTIFRKSWWIRWGVASQPASNTSICNLIQYPLTLFVPYCPQTNHIQVGAMQTHCDRQTNHNHPDTKNTKHQPFNWPSAISICPPPFLLAQTPGHHTITGRNISFRNCIVPVSYAICGPYPVACRSLGTCSAAPSPRARHAASANSQRDRCSILYTIGVRTMYSCAFDCSGSTAGH